MLQMLQNKRKLTKRNPMSVNLDTDLIQMSLQKEKSNYQRCGFQFSPNATNGDILKLVPRRESAT